MQLEGAAASGAAGTDPCERRRAWRTARRRSDHLTQLELETWSRTQMVALGAGTGLDRAGETGSGRERGQPGSAVCQPSAGSALAASAQVQTEPEDGAQMLQVWR